MATTEELLREELERQKRERIREGWEEFRKKNPDYFKSKTPVVETHFAPDKLGDEK